jgi:hypothetical protein
MISKRVLTHAGVLSATAGLMLVMTGTAQAAELSLSQGRGYGGHNTYSVYACDTKADGWGVRTYYELSDGYVDLVGDGNPACQGELSPVVHSKPA